VHLFLEPELYPSHRCVQQGKKVSKEPDIYSCGRDPSLPMQNCGTTEQLPSL